MSEVSQTSNMYGVTNGNGGNASSDLSQLHITTMKFDGRNYLSWSKWALIYIEGRDKNDYLTGELEISTPEDPKYWK